MPKPSKAAFVRSMPLTMPAKEVMRRAAKQNLEITEAYVYVIRSKGRAARRQAQASGSGRMDPRERTFIDLALDLGIGRTGELLERVKSARAAALAS